jgi:hypothetical protein
MTLRSYALLANYIIQSGLGYDETGYEDYIEVYLSYDICSTYCGNRLSHWLCDMGEMTPISK